MSTRQNKIIPQPVLGLVFLLGILPSAGCGGSETLSPSNDAGQGCVLEELATGLDHPFGLLVENSDVIVSGYQRVVRITPDKQVTTLTPLLNGTGLTRKNGEAFGLDFMLQKVVRFDAKTWQPTDYAALQAGPISLDVDGDDLIVTGFTDPMFMSNPLLRVKPDGTVETIAKQGLGAPSGVLTDGDGYLVSDYAGGRLLRVKKTGEVSVVATNLGNPVEFRRHGDYYYVGDNAGGVARGRILRVSLSGEVVVVQVPDNIGNPSSMLINGTEMLLTDDQHGRVLVLRGCLE